MKARLIEVLSEKCTGCRYCEAACSFHHESEGSASKSRIRIIKDDKFGDNLIKVCIQCAEAYCIEACPIGALHRDEATKAVLVDARTCNGCEACVTACPLNALVLDKKRGIIFKCDLCGGDPACVEMCTRDAIVLKDEDIASPARKEFMQKVPELIRKSANP